MTAQFSLPEDNTTIQYIIFVSSHCPHYYENKSQVKSLYKSDDEIGHASCGDSSYQVGCYAIFKFRRSRVVSKGAQLRTTNAYIALAVYAVTSLNKFETCRVYGGSSSRMS